MHLIGKMSDWLIEGTGSCGCSRLNHLSGERQEFKKTMERGEGEVAATTAIIVGFVKVLVLLKIY